MSNFRFILTTLTVAVIPSLVLDAKEPMQWEQNSRPTPLVNVDALHLRKGPATEIENLGSYKGRFVAQGAYPLVELVDGRKALTLNGQCGLESTFKAGPEITGRSDFTVAVWAYNPEICVEECLVSWSERVGPDGTAAQLNYGTNKNYGAVCHWRHQMGYRGDAPAPGQWHHIVLTYDGIVERLYVDGLLNNTQSKPLDIRPDEKIHIGSTGQMQFFSGAISKVQIYDIALSQSDVSYSYLTGNRPASVQQWWLTATSNYSAISDDLKTIRFLELKLAQYEKVDRRSVCNINQDPIYSEMWYLLGRARERAGSANANIIAAYKKAMYSPHAHHALDTLVSFLSEEDLKHIFERTSKEREKDNLVFILVNMLHDKTTQSSMKGVLELLSKAKIEVNDVLDFIHQATTGQERDLFVDLCRKNPRYGLFALEKDLQSVEALALQEKYKDAAKECRRVLPSHILPRSKVTLEFKLAEYLKESGQTREALSILSSFQDNRRHVNRDVAARALCLKGQCYIEMGDLERAMDCLLGLISEYPESSKSPTAAFLIGYIHMLESKFDVAKDAFEYTAKQYPGTRDSEKAMKYAMRLESILGG